ncbi:MAG TPA: PRC-barrel domain-containing protein [Acidimicrobiales bacterium]|nr:PRC-barrel domain-containing protein [Acidimicrobiales bacterium]
MKLLMTASQIHGLPVVTVRGGEDVAEVRDVIYSPEAGRLIGVTLNKRGFLAGRSREVLPAEAIHAIGQHAVMVLEESSLVARDDAPDEVAHPATERDVLGNDVLTEGGASLGTVSDLVLLVGSSGEVVGYQIDKAGGGQGYLPLPAQLSVSGVALVVPNVTEEFVADDLVGLGASVDDFRDRLGLK